MQLGMHLLQQLLKKICGRGFIHMPPAIHFTLRNITRLDCMYVMHDDSFLLLSLSVEQQHVLSYHFPCFLKCIIYRLYASPITSKTTFALKQLYLWMGQLPGIVLFPKCKELISNMVSRFHNASYKRQELNASQEILAFCRSNWQILLIMHPFCFISCKVSVVSIRINMSKTRTYLEVQSGQEQGINQYNKPICPRDCIVYEKISLDQLYFI